LTDAAPLGNPVTCGAVTAARLVLTVAALLAATGAAGASSGSGRDRDRDGVPDARDVCPQVRNPAQLDSDLDGRGDACDHDDDGDSLSDDAERFLRTSPTDRDTDDDGLSDSVEERLGTSGRLADTDRDRLPDGLEAGVRRPLADPPGRVRGTDRRRFRRDLDPRTRTSPLRRDTDRDGRIDGVEDRNRNGRLDRGETDPRRRDAQR